MQRTARVGERVRFHRPPRSIDRYATDEPGPFQRAQCRGERRRADPGETLLDRPETDRAVLAEERDHADRPLLSDDVDQTDRRTWTPEISFRALATLRHFVRT
jgi:hypothetical protein